jgi:hypothetical protein
VNPADETQAHGVGLRRLDELAGDALREHALLAGEVDDARVLGLLAGHPFGQQMGGADHRDQRQQRERVGAP